MFIQSPRLVFVNSRFMLLNIRSRDLVEGCSDVRRKGIATRVVICVGDGTLALADRDVMIGLRDRGGSACRCALDVARSQVCRRVSSFRFNVFA